MWFKRNIIVFLGITRSFFRVSWDLSKLIFRGLYKVGVVMFWVLAIMLTHDS